MKKRSIIATCILAAVSLILALCPPALAASSVTISAAGNNVFSVEGAGIESAAALEITVSYDTTRFPIPASLRGR